MSTLACDWHDVETELIDRGFVFKPHVSGRGHILTACYGDADISIATGHGYTGELWSVSVLRIPRATGRPTGNVELPAWSNTAFALAIITAACAPLPTTEPTSRSTR